MEVYTLHFAAFGGIHSQQSQKSREFSGPAFFSGVKYMTPTNNFMHYKNKEIPEKNHTFPLFDPPRVGVVDPRM